MNHDPNLYPDGDFSFQVNGGEYYDTGWHWPALLRVTMNHRDALRTMQYLLAQIADPDREDIYELTWSGSLVRLDEEGEPINLDGSPKSGPTDMDGNPCIVCGATAKYIVQNTRRCEVHKRTVLEEKS
jgi:hypothetical protein